MSNISEQLVVDASRKAKLLEELCHAIQATPQMELTAWGGRLPKTMWSVTRQRATSLKDLATGVGNFFGGEGKNWYQAYKNDGGWEHFSTRINAAKTTSVSTFKSAHGLIKNYSVDLSKNPEKEAPKLIALILGFLIGSGGIDGDGGVPDLDLLGGIGAHRSIFTHSIISGIVLETVILGVADLARTIHNHLPLNHDPLWNKLAIESETVVPSLIHGLSAGIAFHLGVDSTIDGDGIYRDLPVSAPQDVHQAITGVNAVAEGTYASRRNRTYESKPTAIYCANFKEAQEKAKANWGSTITRISNGSGYIVTLKA